PVARVGETYLYEDEIQSLVSEDMSPQDSTVLVNNFINNWATQQLLMANAVRNLNDEKQQEFNSLVDQYRKDLFTQAYLEALVGRKIDSTVTLEEARKYYDENKEVFKLNEELIKFRYINLQENRSDFEDIKKKFQRFNEEDKKELDSISIQFKSYSLNDSIWVKVSQVLDKIPVANASNKEELLKKSNFIQLKDSLGVYLMHINDVLLRNDTAPLEYVKPTIDQIVINRRKLEFINDLKTDITKDAIKNKQFELYN
ncbi:MAG: peptidyl-prolyl cis-trans isomerase, partial [Mangrovimonas sp.]|nr:peptidyl-prolyl cis-trans isomerase [Mangrovimonas sp.]MCB0470814.1 peptidyl-prolyl cis-trans isomerase [Flavobacteriaceae bacterium]